MRGILGSPAKPNVEMEVLPTGEGYILTSGGNAVIGTSARGRAQSANPAIYNGFT